MLYILFVVTCVSSGFASPRRGSQHVRVFGTTCVNDGICNSCTPKWQKDFGEVFKVLCSDQRLNLIYRDWVAHLIDFFVYKIWQDSSLVRIFRVTREKDCSRMRESAVEMLDRIRSLNRWKKIETCEMFKKKMYFACNPYREHHPSGWWWWSTIFTTEHVVLCAFTGLQSSPPISEEKWKKLENCINDWKKCGY